MAVTRLGIGAVPSRPYGSFANKEQPLAKSNIRFTQLGVYGAPARRYPAFETDTALGSISGSTTLSFGVNATLDQAANFNVNGTTTLPFTVGATLDFAAAGDGFSINADVTTDLLTAATLMDKNPNFRIAASNSLLFTTGGTTVFGGSGGITGGITTTFLVNGTTLLSDSYFVTGDGNLSFAVEASDLSFTRLGTGRALSGTGSIIFNVNGTFFLNGVRLGGSARTRRTRFMGSMERPRRA